MGVLIRCPHCQSSEVVRHGKSTNGKHKRFQVTSRTEVSVSDLQLEQHPGRNREVKQQILEMTLNGSGVEMLLGFYTSVPQQL